MDNTKPQPLLLKPEDAARLLGISRSTVFDLIAHGKIESLKIGRSRRILQSEIEKFIGDLIQGQSTTSDGDQSLNEVRSHE